MLKKMGLVDHVGDLSRILNAAKILYSLGLMLAIGCFLYLSVAFAREILRVWGDRSTYLTEFVFDDGGESRPLMGRKLTQKFQTSLKELEVAFQKKDDPSVPEGAKAALFVPPMSAFATDTSPLANLNLAWQGVDVGGLLNAFRNLAWKPETLTAQISRVGNNAEAALFWSNPPKLPDSLKSYSDNFFSLRNRKDENTAVLELASRVFWRNAVSAHEPFRAIDPDVFCEWVILEDEAQELERKHAKTAAGLGEADIKRLEAMSEEIGVLIGREADFDSLPRLRQRIISMIPLEQQRDEDRRSIATDIERLTSMFKAPNAAFTQQAISSDAVEKLLGDKGQTIEITPGRPLVAEGESVPFITAGPIVQNKSGERFLVLPDYAVTAASFNNRSGKNNRLAVRLVDGPIIGDLLLDKPAEGSKLALVKLRAGIAARNRISAGPRTVELRAPATPEVGDEAHALRSGLFTKSQTVSQGTVTEVGGSSFKVAPDFGDPGDGGAPIVKPDGTLLGIIHSGQNDLTESPILAKEFDLLGIELVAAKE